MCRALTFGEKKALFRQLVKAAGGTQACALELGVTHQWVSDLQNVRKPALPNWDQIEALEIVAQTPIYTGAHARAIAGQTVGDVMHAAVDAVAASAKVLRLVHDMDADGDRKQGEVRLVQEAARENLAEAQEMADAAARLSATGSEG